MNRDLSKSDVGRGFIISDNRHFHGFAHGELVVFTGGLDMDTFEKLDGSDHRYMNKYEVTPAYTSRVMGRKLRDYT